jgi:hypothetical protein
MGEQPTFTGEARKREANVTRRARSLAEMDAVIRWPRLLALTFRFIEQLRGFQKTRCRDIAKKLVRTPTSFGLASLYSVRHNLKPPGATCAL